MLLYLCMPLSVSGYGLGYNVCGYNEFTIITYRTRLIFGLLHKFSLLHQNRSYNEQNKVFFRSQMITL